MSRQTLANPGPRPLDFADAPALVTLVNSAYRGESSKQGWTTEADLLGGQRIDLERAQQFAEQTQSGGDIQVLVWPWNDGTLAACVSLERRGRAAYLGLLTVAPGRQNAGWGRQLLEQAESWVQKKWGSRKVEMTVISVRSELIAWYERRGYRQTGETRPFPMTDVRFGLPKVAHLEFVVLEKTFEPKN